LPGYGEVFNGSEGGDEDHRYGRASGRSNPAFRDNVKANLAQRQTGRRRSLSPLGLPTVVEAEEAMPDGPAVKALLNFS